MIHSHIMTDVALAPMLLFNPITLALLAIAVTALIVAVVISARRRKKEQIKLQEKLFNDMKQDPMKQGPDQ